MDDVQSTWSEEDWERAGNPKLVPDEVSVVPIRHPDNDDTWSVGVYDPSSLAVPGRLVWGGHKLRGIFTRVRAKTFQEAQREADRLLPRVLLRDPEDVQAGFARVEHRS